MEDDLRILMKALELVSKMDAALEVEVNGKRYLMPLFEDLRSEKEQDERPAFLAILCSGYVQDEYGVYRSPKGFKGISVKIKDNP